MYVELMINLSVWPIPASRCLLDSLRPPEPKNDLIPIFLDMMYFELMKNFLLADSERADAC